MVFLSESALLTKHCLSTSGGSIGPSPQAELDESAMGGLPMSLFTNELMVLQAQERLRELIILFSTFVVGGSWFSSARQPSMLILVCIQVQEIKYRLTSRVIDSFPGERWRDMEVALRSLFLPISHMYMGVWVIYPVLPWTSKF